MTKGTDMRRLVLVTICLLGAAGSVESAAAAAPGYHGCRAYSSVFLAAGGIKAKGMTCTEARFWIDQVTTRMADRSARDVTGTFRIISGQRRMRCHGSMRQGIDPYMHFSCGGTSAPTRGRRIVFNVGS